MPTNPPPDLVLTPLGGKGHTVAQWLTTFHLAFAALDPRTPQSRWILPTAIRVLTNFDQADARVALLITGDELDARRFLGRHVGDLLTFLDPERKAVAAFGLERLPALVHLGMDGAVVNAAEGWDPVAWRHVAAELARTTGWIAPLIPGPRDPGPFEGSPAA